MRTYRAENGDSLTGLVPPPLPSRARVRRIDRGTDDRERWYNLRTRQKPIGRRFLTVPENLIPILSVPGIAGVIRALRDTSDDNSDT